MAASFAARRRHDSAGFYQFAVLHPGVYSLRERQPAGYRDGSETLGSLGGVAGNDVFRGIRLGPESSGFNYNFGELEYIECRRTAWTNRAKQCRVTHTAIAWAGPPLVRADLREARQLACPLGPVDVWVRVGLVGVGRRGSRFSNPV